MRFGFRMREHDSRRPRERWTSREWWWSPTIPAFWRFRCSLECRYEGREHHGKATLGTAALPCPRCPRYLGLLAKGWWDLLTWRKDYKRWSTEVTVALGGEDRMLQVYVCLPLLGSLAVGVRFPRRLQGWVYQRREWGIELRGLWPEVSFAFDSDMRDMEDYYRRTYGGPGQEPMPSYLNRVALWSGWWWRPNPYRARRVVADLLFGEIESGSEVLKVYEDCGVPLPEGVYQGTVSFVREWRKRPRWFALRDDVYGKFKTADGKFMPWPGKGENSWDCGDDGTQEHTVRIGPGSLRAEEIDGGDVAKVLGGATTMVLGYRARYGRFDWQPEALGVMRD